MAATTVSIQPRPCSANFQALSLYSSTNSHLPIRTFLQLQRRPAATLLLLLQKGRNPIHNNGFWGVSSRSGMVMGDYGGDFDDEDDEEDEEEDRSLDLLIRFVENVFKKVSRKARKAVKSVLPIPISTKLVGFAVNGTIILTFLWVLKAFLEVICTLGSVVFTSILLIRGIWTGISYFQESRSYRPEDDEPEAWTGTQPAI
ncbi:uncharacterized protein [Primulina eburnea]|uniref:uncharacterized protein isoform X1 n=1 Tax=Primulina eburnea TaxID=1245227 RepID=UPI003C6C4724